MADQTEQAFVRTLLNTISSQPITFPDDYQQPLADSLKRVPVLPIPVPAPPARVAENEAAADTASSSALLSVTFKSLKPAASYTLSVHPTDTIASIKKQLASEPTAPPADAQRLLLKGKALADAKLLKEYPIKNGDTINLVLKPGSDWDPSKPKGTEKGEEVPMDVDNKIHQPVPVLGTAGGRPKHQRIPSVVLSPSPSSETPGMVEKDIVLTLDSGPIPDVPPETLSSYATTISKPEFWEKLFAFLKSEFATGDDALSAFETFFRASKGAMTASQIAKIRDQVGIVGMAGT